MQMRLRSVAAVGLAVASITSGSAVLLLSAPPAAADGVCGAGASESGMRGGFVACVVNKTGRIFWVEI